MTSPLRYLSTRGAQAPLPFQDAVLCGLADDGGLLVPETLPDARPYLDDWKGLSYADLAFAVMRLFAPDFPAHRLRALLSDAYASFEGDDPAPVRPLEGDLWLLELFHGPTLAFKDFALQVLGRLFAEILSARGEKLNIVAATSGDTGSAAICGVRGQERVGIFVMHPHGRVSPLQERQMTSVLDGNVFNIALEGSFDDCQNLMKKLFGDLPFKREYRLGAVNSVNWARIASQIVYYFYAAFRVMEETGKDEVQFAVPTGNFGDILAGWYAKRMGLPVRRLVLATNENDILARFFHTGRYVKGEVVRSLSPSMDIQVASNFERWLFERLGRDPLATAAAFETFAATGEYVLPGAVKGAIDREIVAAACDRQRTLATIAKHYRAQGILLDPHTAAGVFAAKQYDTGSTPTICLATAHPAKFPAAIREALGEDVPEAHHPVLDALADAPTRMAVLPNDCETVRAFVAEHAK
ncbi:MAG: threonine synthase [Kiritimatiellae bacterium]|nr:threonine synthase [Kiritimatiellia bacterium]